MVKEGKAYGFFDCNASKYAIESELSLIRRLVKTPSELELSLMELTENPSVSSLRDSKLRSIVNDAKDAGIRYFMEATYLNGTNKQTADEVAKILNQAYHSPLYQKGEEFGGAIVYEENGKYVF